MKKLLTLGVLVASLTLAGCANTQPTDEEVAAPVAEETATPAVETPVVETPVVETPAVEAATGTEAATPAVEAPAAQ